MTQEHTAAARAWLEEVLGADGAVAQASAWDQFAAGDRPVVTLLGAYDTGKSALVRRLLVDAGLEVPEWVTISARHETYEVGAIDFRGVILRDTPGLAPGADDARAVANTAKALQAAALTDALVVVVNPQLPTAERDLLLTLLGDRWPAGSILLVISKFDSTGVSPEYDLDGYYELAARKGTELRRSLSLDADVPVQVVSPDAEAVAGVQRQPDPSVWDRVRPWDGMAELADTIAAVADADLSDLRAAAEERYWVGAVRLALTEVEAGMRDLETATDVARSLRLRRDAFHATLDAQEHAARVSIDGAVEEAIRSTMRRQSVDEAAIESAVNQCLDVWWAEQEAELDRVLRDAQATMDEQRQRPAWQALANVLTPADESEATKRKRTTKLQPLTEKFSTAVDKVDKLRQEVRKGLMERAKEAAGTNAGATKVRLPKGKVAAAALPVVIELLGLLEDEADDRRALADRQARRAELQEQVTRIATEAGEQTMRDWAPHLAQARDHVDAVIGFDSNDVALMEAELSALVGLVSRGTTLLTTG